jgi:hypothetical protein
MSIVGAPGPSALAPHRSQMGTGGGRCWRYQQHPSEGPPSMSPTSVVVVVIPADSTPQGARHRRLQLWWWPLLDMPAAPPRGPTIYVANFGGGRCRTCRQHPQGTRHRRLQLRWWSLPDLSPAPPGGPSSTSPTSGPPASAPPGARCQHVS